MIAFFAFESIGVRINQQQFSSLTRDDFDDIVSERKKDDSLFADILFNGVPLFYDPDDQCYYYSIPENLENAHDPAVSWESNTISVLFEDETIDESLLCEMKTSMFLFLTGTDTALSPSDVRLCH